MENIHRPMKVWCYCWYPGGLSFLVAGKNHVSWSHRWLCVFFNRDFRFELLKVYDIPLVNFWSLLSEFDFESYMSLIMNMKKEIMRLLFYMASSLVIILLPDNARPHVKTTEPHWFEKGDFANSILKPLISYSYYFSSIWTLFFTPKKHSAPK